MKKIIIVLCVFCLSGCSDSSWYLRSMEIENLWRYSLGEGKTIAIIDSGISNRLLNTYEDDIIATYNLTSEEKSVKDVHGHGSEMVALCKEIAPECSLVIIKIIEDDGNTDNELLLEGLKKAYQEKVDIINLSLGGYIENEEVIDYIDKLTDEKIMVVASAGDYGDHDLLFPASLDHVLSVSALDKYNQLWEESNTSEALDCAFPGVNITISSDILDGDVDEEVLSEEESGTSEATIIASSYIALLESYYESIGEAYDCESIKADIDSLGTLSHKKIDYLSLFEGSS